MNSFVYFVQAGTDGPVKIGKANDVEKRIAELQTGCPHKLELLVTVECADALAKESEFHQQFASLRIDRSEWFRWSPALADAMWELKHNPTSDDDAPIFKTAPKEHWEPTAFHRDPMVNAVLNVAAQLASLANATNGLLYGLKYGKFEGMSIAEAIEVASKNVATGLDSLASEIHNK